MTDSEKLIEWLQNKPLNFNKIEKHCNLPQATCNKILSGVIKSSKHHKKLIDYFKNELSWIN